MKSGYRSITKQSLVHQMINGDSKFWLSIWNMKDVAPKVCFFIWKAVLVAGEVGHRITGMSKACKLCSTGDETVIYTLFHCTIVRLVWFRSLLSLRTDGIQGSLEEMLRNLWEGIDQSQLVVFAYTLWEVWKSRYACLYGGKKQLVVGVLIATLAGVKRARNSGVRAVERVETGRVKSY